MKKPDFDYEEQIPAGYYDEIYQRKAGVRYCWHDLKFRAVAAHLPVSGRLLDIGCGPGTFLGNYPGHREALGVDLSRAQIDYANQHYSTSFRRFSAQSIASLVEAGERFDAITMIELLEHLAPDDAVQLLVQARSLLSAGGTLIMTTPNYRSLWPFIEWGVNLSSSVSYEQQHINKYHRARLVRHLADAGYHGVTVKTVVGLAPFAAVFGPKPVQWLEALESGVGNLGCGNLLLALAKA
jgi:2-polyprenyl-3-methyl-5-hydroxy-6-metoxy-1,4-benzoquinol methylase